MNPKDVFMFEPYGSFPSFQERFLLDSRFCVIFND